MPSQYRDMNCPKLVKKITFGLMSAAQQKQLSHLQVVDSRFYEAGRSRIPIAAGPLDPKLGTCGKSETCVTCGQSFTNCMGHFGHIDLALPVFHTGFLKHTVKILQSICKTCSCVMLPSYRKIKLAKRVNDPSLDYLHKKVLRKQIHEEAKKMHICPHCNQVNGVIKKVGLVYIFYEKFRDASAKQEPLTQYLAEFTNVNVNLGNKSGTGFQSLDLMALAKKGIFLMRPAEVMELFEAIPNEDICLLLMHVEHSHPRNLLFTRILVPPNVIRPSVVSSFRVGTNEDDITVILSSIITINETMKAKVNSGAEIREIQLLWDYLQCEVAKLINSDAPGMPNFFTKGGNWTRSFVQRLEGKQGRFRGNLCGKRTDFTSRTVISPDPNMHIDELCVPEYCAKILTFPETVTPFNIEHLKSAVRNGLKRHPGALYVVPKTSIHAVMQYQLQSALNKIRLEHPRVCDKTANELKVGDVVERHLVTGDIVLFNRQPSLHRISIQAFKAVVKPGRTFRFNECCCTPFNADFDGDEMNLHLPQTWEARAEAVHLLGCKLNIVTPRNGEPLIAAIQDFITGAYILTRKDTFFTRNRFCQIVGQMFSGTDIAMKMDLPRPAIIKPITLWTGKQLFSLVMKPNTEYPVEINLRTSTKAIYEKDEELCPSDGFVVIHKSELLAGSLEKKTLGSGSKLNIFYVMLRDFGCQVAADTMWRMTRIIPAFLFHRGFSIGIHDVTPSSNLLRDKKLLIDEGFLECQQSIRNYQENNLVCQPGCGMDQTLENLVSKALSYIREAAGKSCKKELHCENAALVMAKCGSKGSFLNISQMTACVGQQVISGKRAPDGFEDRCLPHFERSSKVPEAKGFVANSFFSGLTPYEFYFHTMSGREGLVDTAVKTADTGYMQRRLIKALEDLCANYDGTVGSNSSEIVQFMYGGDNLDPCIIESDTKPVDFERVMLNVRLSKSNESKSDNRIGLSPAELLQQAEFMVKSEEFVNTCSDAFCVQILDYIENMANKIDKFRLSFGITSRQLESELPLIPPVIWEYCRITRQQLHDFLTKCLYIYKRSHVEPGCPLGAICAQSIGEPTTQMTLKTFHFAGVASMNITQGVPRIKEIINAVRNISTPLITAYIRPDLSHSEDYSRKLKMRIEQTLLTEVTQCMQFVMESTCVYLLIRLDWPLIEALYLDITLNDVCDAIQNSRMKVKLQKINTNGSDEVYIFPQLQDQHCLLHLKSEIKKVMIKGLPKIKRSVLHQMDKKTSGKEYVLFVEGDNYAGVLATPGVDGTRSRYNNILEVAKVLGIEAARRCIIDEMLEVMRGHGVDVDIRHVMLLADQMTYKGEVLGCQRHGISKLKEGVLMLASFEQTSDHLYEAAYHGQVDDLSGVSESIILGKPVKLGTGMFGLLVDHSKIQESEHNDSSIAIDNVHNMFTERRLLFDV